MKIENNFCVLDLETNGLSLDSNILEIACLILDPFKLEIIPGSEWSTLVRPDNLDDLDNSDEKKKALDVCKITKGMLKNQPVIKAALPAFFNHIRSICGKKGPIPSGYNIINFDLPLINHNCKQMGLAGKDGKNKIFITSFVCDIKDDINRFFFQDERLLYQSFDSIRKLFGMETNGSHRALFDVKQEAWLIKKLLTTYKSISPKLKFEGSAYTDGGIIK